jgi:hypothetical protein
MREAVTRKTAPMIRKGSFGSPGTRPMTAITPAASIAALGWDMISPDRSLPRFSSEAVRVTIRPAAVEISSAGICDTSPSPTVSRV